jgi:hypothetical protein
MQQRRGRPGPSTAYVRIEEQRFPVKATIADDVVRDDACFDGCWPTMTSDKAMTAAELLCSMKRQLGIGNRHHALRVVVAFVPIYLKSNERIDAFGVLGYVAVLLRALIEREPRRAMDDAKIDELPLYLENRPCKAPTAARILELLDPLARSVVSHRGQVLTVVAPTLSALVEQILTLLGIVPSAYGLVASRPGNST